MTPSVRRGDLSIYIPTYDAPFRCPECDAVLKRALTVGGGPRLEVCGCGYDHRDAHARAPVPIP